MHEELQWQVTRPQQDRGASNHHSNSHSHYSSADRSIVFRLHCETHLPTDHIHQLDAQLHLLVLLKLVFDTLKETIFDLSNGNQSISHSLPSGTVTVTNAPKPSTGATLLVSRWSDEMPSKADRSAGGRADWVLPPTPAFVDKDILPLSRSTLMTRTLTFCPASTTLDTSSTKPSIPC